MEPPKEFEDVFPELFKRKPKNKEEEVAEAFLKIARDYNSAQKHEVHRE